MQYIALPKAEVSKANERHSKDEQMAKIGAWLFKTPNTRAIIVKTKQCGS